MTEDNPYQLPELDSIFFQMPALDPAAGYWCPHCKEQVAGLPKQYRVNDLGILSGRKGVVTECRQCGLELHFSGMRA